MADPPERILLEYVLSRLEQINSNEYQTDKGEIKECMVNACGLQLSSAELRTQPKVLKALDYIKNNPCQSFNLDVMSPSTDVKDDAILQLFKSDAATWEQIVGLLEFVVNLMVHRLKNSGDEKVNLACAVFDWLVRTFRKRIIGKSAHTLKRQIHRHGGWKSLLTDTALGCHPLAAAPQAAAPQAAAPQGNIAPIYLLQTGSAANPAQAILGNTFLPAQFIEASGQTLRARIAPGAAPQSSMAPGAAPQSSMAPGAAPQSSMAPGAAPQSSRAPGAAPQSSRALVPNPYLRTSTLQYFKGPILPTCPDLCVPVDSITFAVCVCGNRVKRSLGFLVEQCAKCDKFLCMVTNCRINRENNQTPYCKSTRAYINTHLVGAHYPYANPNACFHCGAPKMRGQNCSNTCPACKAKWCLLGNCTHEFDNGLAGLGVHRNACQLKNRAS